MPADFDVVIVGAGLVGASLAQALVGSGLSVALVEPSPPSPPSDAWDARIYAVSPGSVEFLESVGAWRTVDPDRLQPVERMAVFGDGAAALRFSAYEAGVARLATIMESGRLAYGLWTQLSHDVTVLAGERCAMLEIAPDGVLVRMQDDAELRARLVVGADGAASWVRREAGMTAWVHDYGQQGVVANFDCEKPHEATAFQWFRPDGVLAYLPLPGRRMSMVWSTPTAHADELLALDADALAQRVAIAGRHSLGALRLITPAQAFPLRRLSADSLVAPRVALIGDAAHVVHPLAGQGVNLGFGDVAALAEILREREPFRDVGDLTLLRRYARSRAEAILAMRTVTDGLAKLFGASGRVAGEVRNRGLNLTDRLPVLKTLLVRHALG